MATNESISYKHDEEEYYQTALEEQFTELSLVTDAFHGISPITHIKSEEISTKEYNDHADINKLELASAFQNMLSLKESPKPITNFTETNSSTPKRKLHFIRNSRNVKIFNKIIEEVESNDQQHEQDIKKEQSAAALSEQLLPVAVNLPTELETDILTPLPSLTQIIREQRRRSQILSPFSQKIKIAILQKDNQQKNQKRIEASKKAQRVSLRV